MWRMSYSSLHFSHVPSGLSILSLDFIMFWIIKFDTCQYLNQSQTPYFIYSFLHFSLIYCQTFQISKLATFHHSEIARIHQFSLHLLKHMMFNLCLFSSSYGFWFYVIFNIPVQRLKSKIGLELLNFDLFQIKHLKQVQKHE